MMRISLRKTLFILPNLFTLSSVFCSFYAIIITTTPNTSSDFYRAGTLIAFSMLFDLLDGRVARLTKTQSAIGVQLDSLADVISFGVAPAIVVYRWSLQDLAAGHALGQLSGIVACFVYVACATIRLARFNVLVMAPDGAPKVPGKYILGLPTPAAAAVLISIVMANAAVGVFEWSPWIVLSVVLTMSGFMVSNIRFRSFKDLRLNARVILSISLVAIVTVILSRMFHASFALAWILTAYLTIAVVEMMLGWAKKARGRRAVES